MKESILQSLPVNQFDVDSEFEFVEDPFCAYASRGSYEPLLYRYSAVPLETFPAVACVARGPHGGVVRAYDVGDRILLRLSNLVDMAVYGDGRVVDFHFAHDDPNAAALARGFAINMAPALCTLLRGDVALHAACLMINDGLTAIMGASGAGKSTLTWSLLQAGARFATDDMTAIRVDGSTPTVFPSVSLSPKVSAAAALAQGVAIPPAIAAYPASDEVYVPIPGQQRVLAAGELAALIFLNPISPACGENRVRVRRLSDGDGLGILMQQTQGLWAVHFRLDARRMLAQYRQILRSAPLFILEYPKRFNILPLLGDVIGNLADRTMALNVGVVVSWPHPSRPARAREPRGSAEPPQPASSPATHCADSRTGGAAAVGTSGRTDNDLGVREILRWAAGSPITLPDVGAHACPRMLEAFGVDEDELAELMAFHGVAGRFLIRHASERPVWCTRGLFSAAAHQHRCALANARGQTLALAEVGRSVTPGEPPPVVVKGLTAFALAPDGPPPRWSGDIDLLADDPERLVAHLRSLGYVQTGKQFHETAMRREEILIEVHRGFPVYRYPERLEGADVSPSPHPGAWLQSFGPVAYGELKYADIAPSARRSARAGMPAALFPSLEFAVLLSAIHLFRHYANGIFKRRPLIRLVDLCEMRDLACAPGFDPAELLRLAGRFSVWDSVAFAGHLAHALLGFDGLLPGNIAPRQSFPQYLCKWNGWFAWDDPDRLIEPLDFGDLISHLGANRVAVGDGAFSVSFPGGRRSSASARLIAGPGAAGGPQYEVEVVTEGRDVVIRVSASGLPHDAARCLHVEINGPRYRWRGGNCDLCLRFDLSAAGVQEEAVAEHVEPTAVRLAHHGSALDFEVRVPCRPAILASRDGRNVPLLLSLCVKDIQNLSEDFCRSYEAVVAIPLLIVWPTS